MALAKGLQLAKVMFILSEACYTFVSFVTNSVSIILALYHLNLFVHKLLFVLS